MKIKVIKTDKDYKEATERVYELMKSENDLLEPDSEYGVEVEVLSLLIEQYESVNFPVDPPDPIEALRFRMDQMNLKQKDIAPLLGGETRASEILNRKRSLTLKMITLLNRYLGIPLESLIQGNKDYKLDPERKKKILTVPGIREILNNKNTAIL